MDHKLTITLYIKLFFSM